MTLALKTIMLPTNPQSARISVKLCRLGYLCRNALSSINGRWSSGQTSPLLPLSIWCGCAWTAVWSL